MDYILPIIVEAIIVYGLVGAVIAGVVLLLNRRNHQQTPLWRLVLLAFAAPFSAPHEVGFAVYDMLRALWGRR